MSRIAGITLWLVGVVALAAVWWLGHELGGRPVAPTGTNQPPPAVSKAFLPGPSGDGWKVVHQTSAHHMLVLEVETERVVQARWIAQQLTEPVKDRYTEVMVYVFRPGRRGGLPAARVRWSHRGGYEATDYEP